MAWQMPDPRATTRGRSCVAAGIDIGGGWGAGPVESGAAAGRRARRGRRGSTGSPNPSGRTFSGTYPPSAVPGLRPFVRDPRPRLRGHGHHLPGLRRGVAAGPSVLRRLWREARRLGRAIARGAQAGHGPVRRRDRARPPSASASIPRRCGALMSRYFATMRGVIEAPRRDGREVHRRRGDGRVRDPDRPRGRRPAGGPGRGRDPGRLAALNAELRRAGHRDPLPHRRQHRRGRRRRPGGGPDPGHRRHGQHRGPAGAGGAARRDPARPADLSLVRDAVEAEPVDADRGEGQGRAGRRRAASSAVRAGARGTPAGSTRRWSAVSASSRAWTEAFAQRSRTVVPPVHAARGRRRRQEPPRRRVPGVGRRRGAGAPRSLPVATARASRTGRSARSFARPPGINEADDAATRRGRRSRALLEGEREADASPPGSPPRSGSRAEPRPQEELVLGDPAAPGAPGRDRPLVVVIEDIHWAEPTLSTSRALADWTRDAPILLLCPARPELLDARAGWARRHVTRRPSCSSHWRADATRSSSPRSRAARALPPTLEQRIAAAPRATRCTSRSCWRCSSTTGSWRGARRRLAGRRRPSTTSGSRPRSAPSLPRASRRLARTSGPSPSVPRRRSRLRAGRRRELTADAAPPDVGRTPARTRPQGARAARARRDLLTAGDRLQVSPRPHPRRGVRRAAEGRAGGPHERFADWLRAHRGRPPRRARGDRRVPPRAAHPYLAELGSIGAGCRSARGAGGRHLVAAGLRADERGMPRRPRRSWVGPSPSAARRLPKRTSSACDSRGR